MRQPDRRSLETYQSTSNTHHIGMILTATLQIRRPTIDTVASELAAADHVVTATTLLWLVAVAYKEVIHSSAVAARVTSTFVCTRVTR